MLISNIRNKVAGVDWGKQPPWIPLAHILKKNEEGGGYLFGIEIINGIGILDDMTSESGDTVRPATIEEALAVLEKEKPLEYKLLRSLKGMSFGDVNLVD